MLSFFDNNLCLLSVFMGLQAAGVSSFELRRSSVRRLSFTMMILKIVRTTNKFRYGTSTTDSVRR